MDLVACASNRTGSRAKCPICGVPLMSPIWVCRHCETPHHRDCAEYFGGCAIFGCRDGHLPQPIEQASWPGTVRALRRVALARHVQTGSLICAVAFVSILIPGLVFGFLPKAGATLLLLPLICFSLLYAAIDALVIPTLTALLSIEMGRKYTKSLEFSQRRLHHALPAVRNASARFTWLDTVGKYVIGAGVPGFLLIGRESGSVVFVGAMFLVAANQLRKHLSDIEVSMNRFEATHAPRLPIKPAGKEETPKGGDPGLAP